MIIKFANILSKENKGEFLLRSFCFIRFVVFFLIFLTKVLSSHAFSEVIQIYYLQQLDKIRDTVNWSSKTYILMRDLDFNSDDSYDQSDSGWQTKKAEWTNPAKGWKPIGDSSLHFQGTFDGNGHKITGICLTNSRSDYYIGLFGAAGSNSVIKNLTVSGSYENKSWHYATVGMLAGLAKGTIESCSVTSSKLHGLRRDNTIGIGGLIGYAYNEHPGRFVTIKNCFVSSTVSISHEGTNFYVGGLIGRSLCSTEANNIVQNCYSAAKVWTSSHFKGGLIGYASRTTIESCYYDRETSGQSDEGKGTPKTTYEMTQEATFHGWDFQNVWRIRPQSKVNNGYPYLFFYGDICTWEGKGIDKNWSTKENWKDSVVPTNRDIVIYATTDASFIDSGFTSEVYSIQLSTYCGQVTQQRNLTVKSNFSILGGKFIQNSGVSLSVEGDFICSGPIATYECSDPSSSPFFVGGSFSINQLYPHFYRFSGSGTSSNPYKIYDVYGLQGMWSNLSANYELANDIDASPTSRWNYNAIYGTYEGFIPIGQSTYSLVNRQFRGVLDGKHRKISNLYIKHFGQIAGFFGSRSTRGGLFGRTVNASIKNLTIEDAYLAIYNVSGGILAGYCENSTIRGCSVSGNMEVPNSSSDFSLNFGLLIGNAYNSNISWSKSNGVINLKRDPNSLLFASGGLIGALLDSSLSNSYSTASISLEARNTKVISGYGGLVGIIANGSTITKCFSDGKISSAYLLDNIGGLVGYSMDSSTIESSYFSDSTYDNGIGEFRTNSQLSQEETFADWNIAKDPNGFWHIDENISHPYFVWEKYKWSGDTSNSWRDSSNWFGDLTGYPDSNEDIAYAYNGERGIVLRDTSLTIRSLVLTQESATFETDATFSNSYSRGVLHIGANSLFDIRNRVITLEGSLFVDSTSTFLTSGSSVFFGGTQESVVSGSITLNNVFCSTPGKQITFNNGLVLTTQGTVEFKGQDGNEIVLSGDTNDSTWYIYPSSTVTAEYVIVANSYNLGSVITAENSYDGGGNYGWDFRNGGGSVTVSSNEGGKITPFGVNGRVSIPTSESKTFTVEALEGYYIGYVKLNGIKQTLSNTHEFSTVIFGNTGHNTLEAFFVKEGYRYWSGNGSNNNWTNMDNWLGNYLPQANDIAVFSGISTKNAIINTPLNISGILIEKEYTGTITQIASVTLSTSFEQYGGNFVCTVPIIFPFSTQKNFYVDFSNASFKRFSGSGTAPDPYEIYDIYGLQGLNSDLSAHYVLKRSLDASQTRNWNWNSKLQTFEGFIPIGFNAGFSSIFDFYLRSDVKIFQGNFEGEYNSISNLYVNHPNDIAVGLFGFVSNSAISNLSLDNFYLSGNQSIGGLAGLAIGCSISNVNVSGEVYSKDSKGAVGGLIGSFNDSLVAYCTSNVSINITNPVENLWFLQIIGFAGGLIGVQDESTTLFSYSLGKISCPTTIYGIGGLIGSLFSKSSLSQCYSDVELDIPIRDFNGSLVGYASSEATIFQCFARQNNASTNNYGYIVNSEELKYRSTFLPGEYIKDSFGWNFGFPWLIDEGISSPRLYWSEYIWTGAAGDYNWKTLTNWKKNFSNVSVYPSTSQDMVCINGDQVFSTPSDSKLYLSDLILTPLFEGTLSLGNDLTLYNENPSKGSLYILGGEFYAGSWEIQVSRDFRTKEDSILGIFEGFFNYGIASTVKFIDNTKISTVKGNNTFYNLYCDVPGKRLVFNSGDVQTIESYAYFSRESNAGSLIVLSPSTSEHWYIHPKGSKVFSGLNVSYSYNISSEPIHTQFSYDGHNNVNWDGFVGIIVRTISNSGGTIEPPGEVQVNYGSIVSFEVNTNEGYYIGFVRIDGRSTTESLANPPITFYISAESDVQSIEVYFVQEGVKAWTGDGPTPYWSDPLNWTGVSTPQVNERIVFNEKASKRYSILDQFNPNNNILGVSIESSSDIIITQEADLTVLNDYIQSSGNFVCLNPQSYGFNVEGQFNIPQTISNSGLPYFMRVSGEGTEGNPYLIYDVYGLQGIAGFPPNNLYFKLNNDIDASITSKWNYDNLSGDYQGFIPIGFISSNPFTQNSFNGNYYTISNLWIKRSNSDNVGLFGNVRNTNIYALKLSNATIEGYTNVGGITGSINSGTIYNCYFVGSVTANNYNSGGICGLLSEDGSIFSSKTDGNFNSKSYKFNQQGVIHDFGSGGIVGCANGGTISNCYSLSNVSGIMQAGGISGYLAEQAAISNCYFDGSLSGSQLGGIVGYVENDESYQINSSFFDNISFENGYGTYTPESYMKSRNNFTNWNFGSVWSIDDGYSYPYLLWEKHLWTGAGGDSNFLNKDNWSIRTAPSSASDKIFISTSESDISLSNSVLNLGGIQLCPMFNKRLILGDNSGIYLSKSNNIDANLLIFGGTFEVSSSSPISVEGIVYKSDSADFICGDGSFYLTGNDAAGIYGSFNFNNLVCEVPGKTLRFEESKLQNILGKFVVSGGSSNPVYLRSSSDESVWRIKPSSAEVQNVDVKDSTNEADFIIKPLGNSIDSGNNFRWFEYDISAYSFGSGSISPSGEIKVNFDQNLTIDITPESGYSVLDVIVDGQSLGPRTSYTFSNIRSDHTFIALFSDAIKIITAETNGSGSGSISPSGLVTIYKGQNKVFALTPEAGNYLAYVRKDGRIYNVGSSGTYLVTFESVEENHTLEAYFLPNTDCVWTGLGETNYWTEPSNWSGNISPEQSSKVIFNDLGSKDSIVDIGAVNSLYVTKDFIGKISLNKAFTIESVCSIEGGTFTQETYPLFIGGTFYCSNDAQYNGNDQNIYFTKDSGIQYLYMKKTIPNDINSINFGNFIHSGNGSISLEGDIVVKGNFVNSVGNFYGINTNVLCYGNFINSSGFTLEPQLNLDLSYRSGSIIFSGEAQKYISTINANVSIPSIVLNQGAKLQLQSDMNVDFIDMGENTSFDASNYDVTFSSLYNPRYFAAFRHLYIKENPQYLKTYINGLYGSPDTSVLGNLTAKGLSCIVPSKCLRFYGQTTIEAGGFITLESSNVSNPDQLLYLLKHSTTESQWIIDAKAQSRSVRYVYVQDSKNVDANPIVAYNSADGGNNEGWELGYYVFATSEGGGTLTPSGMSYYNSGVDATFEINAQSGNYIGYILIDGSPEIVSGENPTSYILTLESIASNHTLEVIFLNDQQRIWSGQGTSSDWSDPLNWTGSVTPSAISNVYFTDLSSKNSKIDELFQGTIGNFYIREGYKGTIEANRIFTVESDISMESGSFLHKSSEMYIGGNFYNSSKMFTGFVGILGNYCGSFTSEGKVVFSKNVDRTVFLGNDAAGQTFFNTLLVTFEGGRTTFEGLLACGGNLLLSGEVWINPLVCFGTFENYAKITLYDQEGFQILPIIVLGDFTNESGAVINAMNQNGYCLTAIYGNFVNKSNFGIKGIASFSKDFINDGSINFVDIGQFVPDTDLFCGTVIFNGEENQLIKTNGTEEGKVLPIVLHTIFDILGERNKVGNLILDSADLKTYYLDNIGTVESTAYSVQTGYLNNSSNESLSFIENVKLIKVPASIPSLTNIVPTLDVSYVAGKHIIKNLECSIPSNTIYFGTGPITIEVNGHITLEGGTDLTEKLKLRTLSDNPDPDLRRWLIDPITNDRNIVDVDVADSHNIDESAIDTLRSIDSGNNIGWNLQKTISVTHNLGGVVSPDGVSYYNIGDDAQITVSTNEGYYIGSVLVDGQFYGDFGIAYSYPYQINLTNIQSNHTVEVYFLPQNIRIWSGIGSNSKWSNPENWSGFLPPNENSEVVFNSQSGAYAILDDVSYSNKIAGLHMQSGYSGTLVLNNILTIEGNVTIESGTLSQYDFDLYVSGNWLVTNEGFFSSDQGSLGSKPKVVFYGNAQKEIYTGGFDYSQIKSYFYDFYIIGLGKIRALDSILVKNNFVNYSTFEGLNTNLYIVNGFYNYGTISLETDYSLNSANLPSTSKGKLIAFQSLPMIISTGGTGEGKTLPYIDLSIPYVPPTISLESSLQTDCIVGCGTILTNGNNFIITTLASSQANSYSSITKINIISAPQNIKELYNGQDVSFLIGRFSISNLNCNLPSKTLYFYGGPTTIESAGYLTFEGGTGDISTKLRLQSLVSNVPWYLNVKTDKRNVTNVFVSDSRHIGTNSIEASNSYDGGRNSGWLFDKYSITAYCNYGGTIEPYGTNWYSIYSTPEFVVSTNEGVYIVSILKNGEVVGTPGAYGRSYAITFESINSNGSVEAIFSSSNIKIWTGASGTQWWADPRNWLGGTIPTSSDVVVFNSYGSDKNSVVNIESVLGVSVESTYLGEITQYNDLSVKGDFLLNGGTWKTKNQNLIIGGNFIRGNGTFDPSNSKVIISGEGTSLISGETTFNILECNNPWKTLKFESGKLQNVSSKLVLNGSVGGLISLESTVDGERFRIKASSFEVVNVSVKDSTNEGESVINPLGNSVNLGNTSRWFTYYIYSTAEPHATITPEGTREVIITSNDPISYSITSEVGDGYYVASVEVDGIKVAGPYTSLYEFRDVRSNHTIEVRVTTEAMPTDCPRGLGANIENGTEVVLTWRRVEGPLVQYRIYRSSNRFLPLDQWPLVGTTNETVWKDVGITSLTNEAYYVVKAYTAGGESEPSSMGVYKKLVFTKNVSKPNYNRISLPYTGVYINAASLVASIEGGTGNSRINQVAKWDSANQTTTAYSNVTGGGWIGNNFLINPGDGIIIRLSPNLSGSFEWNVAGCDNVTSLVFTKNVSKPNYNRISLPYTGVYINAASLVASIEGGTGNSRINQVAKWDSANQTTTAYSNVTGGGWIGNNFLINPGDGIIIRLSPNLSGSFEWIPGIVIPNKE